jgi:hypothetical protein
MARGGAVKEATDSTGRRKTAPACVDRRGRRVAPMAAGNID